MTIYLIHGDDLSASSRLLLQVPLQGGKRTLDGLKLAPQGLESTLATRNLFTDETILIENLFSRPKSKDKELCLKLLSEYQGDKQILLWEKKELTKATLAKLPKTWKLTLSKLPTLIFAFLDSLYPGNSSQSLKLFHALIQSQEPILVFTMIARHVSNLLIAGTATSPKLPPWQLGKLKTQFSHWSLPALTHFHDELLRIDYQVKSGKTKLDYTTQLDLLLLNLLG